MTVAPTTLELDALKAVLVDAIDYQPVYVGETPFPGEKPGSFLITVDGDVDFGKLATTIHEKVAAPLLQRIAELETAANTLNTVETLVNAGDFLIPETLEDIRAGAKVIRIGGTVKKKKLGGLW